MSTTARIVFAAIAAVLVLTALVLVSPEEPSDQADDPAPTERPQATRVGEAGPGPGAEPTATAESAPPPAPKEVVLRDREARDGVQKIEVKTGERIEFVVSSDAPDEIHLHGYDVTKDVGPGKPARFGVRADIEGIFEVESHEAEHEGKEALIAQVVVEPS